MAADNRLAWFPCYAAQFLSSNAAQTMTNEEFGAYFRLLLNEWLDPNCSLPDDDDTLAALSRAGKRWEKISPRVRKQFTALNGLLFNDVLAGIKQRQLEKAASYSTRGRSGAEKRWTGNGSAIAQPFGADSSAMARPSSPNSSAIENSCLDHGIQKKEYRREKKDKTHGQLTLTAAGVLPFDEQRKLWFAEWWKIYWRKVSKGAAESMFKRYIRTQADFDTLMENTRRQSPVMMQREPDKRPHGSTWIHLGRWSDEETEGLLDARRDVAVQPSNALANDKTVIAMEIWRRMKGANA